ncbi:hypothetical protein GQ42DRAFT_176973 [Ramicandelaber brevisporus]|nr:hypothetical protein GQ42DRAFT_176973 [Ramicandelaber brevisporus]
MYAEKATTRYELYDPKLPTFRLEPERSGFSTGFVVGQLGLEPTRVAGTAIVNYPSSNPVKAQYIEIKLFGQVEVKWEESDTNTDGTSTTSTHYERKTVIDHNMRLFTAKKFDHELLTSARFPFSFSLPNDLPSSLKGRNAEIKYWIEAVICKPGFFFGTKKKAYVELPIVNLGKTVNMIHEMNAGLGRSVEPFDLYLPPRPLAAGIMWRCTLSPHRYIGPGDRIQLNMHIVLPIRIDLSITKVFFGIKQYSQAMDKRERNRDMTKGYIATTTCVDRRLINNSVNLTMFVDIPPLGERKTQVMPTTKTLPLLDIYHKAKVKVYLRGESDIEVEVPVIITPAKQSEVQQAYNRTVMPPQPLGFDAPPSYAVATATTTTTTALANPPGYTPGSAKERY